MRNAAQMAKRWARAVFSGLDWAVREASRPFAPAIRHAGIRRRLAVLRPHDEAGLVRAGCAEQSWLGHWKTAPDRAAGEVEDVLVLLPEDKVLRRRLVLGPAASAHIDDALAHRLGELCPLRPEQALWSWQVVGPAPGGRCEVELAIAHRAESEAFLDRVSGRSVRLAAGLDEAGPVHVLARREGEGVRAAGLLAAALVLALAFAAWATGWRLERDIAALEASRESLLAESRALRVEAETAEALTPVIVRQRAYPDLDDILRAVEEAGALLPADQPIGALVSSQRELRVLDASAGQGELTRTGIGEGR